MTEDWHLLIEAISSLKQESVLENIGWPLVTGTASAIVGVYGSYLTIKHKETIQIEKEKLDSANSLILTIFQAQLDLLTWKTNYIQKLSEEVENHDHPIIRLLSVPKMPSINNPIHYKIESAIFLVKNDKNALEGPSWINLGRIFAMIKNYNELLAIFSKRNDLFEQILKTISVLKNEEKTDQNIYNLVPQDELINAIDLTERMIVSTDDLIIEMASFRKEFPEVSRKLIKTKKIKKYGDVLPSVSPPEQLIHLYKRCSEVNYATLANIIHVDETICKSRYSRGQLTLEKEHSPDQPNHID